MIKVVMIRLCNHTRVFALVSSFYLSSQKNLTILNVKTLTYVDLCVLLMY